LNTPLHLAIINGRHRILEKLLHINNRAEDVDKRPNPFKLNRKNQSAIDLAFLYFTEDKNRKTCLELLINWADRYASTQTEVIRESLINSKSTFKPTLIQMCNEHLFADDPVELRDGKLRVMYVFSRHERGGDANKQQSVPPSPQTPSLVVNVMGPPQQPYYPYPAPHPPYPPHAQHQPPHFYPPPPHHQYPQQPYGYQAQPPQPAPQTANQQTDLITEVTEVSADISFAELEEKIKQAMNTNRWYRMEIKDQTDNSSKQITNDEQVF